MGVLNMSMSIRSIYYKSIRKILVLLCENNYACTKMLHSIFVRLTFNQFNN